jgi:hypothetical protein
MEAITAVRPKRKGLFFALHITVLLSFITAILLTVDFVFVFVPFLRPFASFSSIFSVFVSVSALILVFLAAVLGITDLVLGKIGERYQLAEEKKYIGWAMPLGFYNLGGAVLFMALIFFSMAMSMAGMKY